jgi:hypothetical protein
MKRESRERAHKGRTLSESTEKGDDVCRSSAMNSSAWGGYLREKRKEKKEGASGLL